MKHDAKGVFTNLTATEIAEAVRSGRVTAREVVETTLRRIAEVNPAINAFATVDGDGALLTANRIDAMSKDQRRALPLAGVPFTVKDLIPTAGVATSYGSRAVVGFVPQRDITAIAQLKAAGAILIGKTTTSEFGSSCITKSELCGATRNPWDLTRTPGGSSGGAAATVAAALSPIAVSTDGGGSARIPASCCGILGLKPTQGLIANEHWPSRFDNYSTVSANARTTHDLAAVLTALNGPAALDPLTIGRSRRTYSISKNLTQIPRGLRILHVPTMDNQLVDKDVTQLVALALTKLEAAGAKVDIIKPGFVWGNELARALHTSTLYARLHKLRISSPDMIGPQLAAGLERGAHMSAHDVLQIPLQRTALFERVQTLFERAEVLISPTVTAPPPAFDHDPSQSISINGHIAGPFFEVWYPYTRTFNLTGHPAITVPIGFTHDGLPTGMQIVGAYYSEQLLLDLAAVFEMLSPWSNRWPAVNRRKLETLPDNSQRETAIRKKDLDTSDP